MSNSPEEPIKVTLRVWLCSLAREIGDPRLTRVNPNLRCQLLATGGEEEVRAILQALLVGPPRISPEEFAFEMGKLALHYVRFNLTAMQASLLYGDMYEDLGFAARDELVAAIKKCRTDPNIKYFPTSATLVQLIKRESYDRHLMARGAQRILDALDTPVLPDDSAISAERMRHLLRQRFPLPTQRIKPETGNSPPQPVSTGRATTDAAELANKLLTTLGTLRRTKQ